MGDVMRILFIGGTGFIGPFVVSRLIDKGYEVTVFHRGRTEADPSGRVRHLHHPPHPLGSRDHFQDFQKEFMRISPEVVVDMIAFTEQDAQTLMNTFRGIAERIVVLSSQDVYRAYGRVTRPEPGPPDPVPLSEEAPLRERLYPYRGDCPRVASDPKAWMDDYEKILVEKVVMSDGNLSGTVLRLPMVYGPGDKQHRFYEYIKRMDDDRPAILLEKGMADWRWTRGYVENVAAAVVLAVTESVSSGQIFNVGEVAALRTIDWVRELGRITGWEGEIVVLPIEQMPDPAVPPFSTIQPLVVDTSKIRQVLGYQECVAREEAIRRTVTWERENPPERTDAIGSAYCSEDRVLKEMGFRYTDRK